MFSEGSKGKIGMKRFRKSISVIRKIWVQIFAHYFEMLRKYERIFFLSFFSEKKKKIRNLKVLEVNLLIVGVWQKRSRRVVP